MDVFLVGFRTASHPDARSASGTPDRVRAWLSAARLDHRLREAFVLSTCRRIEWYVVGSAIETVTAAVRDLMGASAEPNAGSGAAPDYTRSGDAARLLLCRVACGLESSIVGEAEVQGQVRRAAALARDARTLGPMLEDAVGAAVRAARRSRTETSIGIGANSAATAAVMLGRRAWGSLRGRSAVVIGAGMTGRQALERLAGQKLASLVVTSRSLAHATDAAARTGAAAHPFSERAAAIAAADLVIAATYASEPVVTADSIRRKSGSVSPQVFVDLSVPRVIDPELGGLPGVSLYTLDDAEAVVAETGRRRLGETPRVEAIALEESLAVRFAEAMAV